MTGMGMSLTLSGSIAMMTAMMVPGVVPELAHRARANGTVHGWTRFTGVYLATWALLGIVMWQLYRQPSSLLAGTLLAAAGIYELTPLKRECRRRCLQHGRSGLRFSVNCVGSSLGLMLALIAIDVMSVPLMCVVAATALLQKLTPPRAALDMPLAAALILAGLVVAAT